MSRAKAKGWCFTSFKDNNWRQLREVAASITITFIGWGNETCPETGKKHQQGFMQFSERVRMTQIKKLINDKAIHLEVTKGSYEDNKKYCSKEGDYQEYGEYSKQGKRTDIARVIESIDEGATTAQLWEQHPVTMVKYERGLMSAKKHRQQQVIEAKHTMEEFKWDEITDWSKSIILWGDAGIGKTEFAKAHFNNPLFVTHMDQLGDLQEEHDGIIFDDMSFLHLPRETQIHLVDQDNPRAIHIRYTTAMIPAGTKKIFTTNVAGGGILQTWDEAILQRVEVKQLQGRNHRK